MVECLLREWHHIEIGHALGLEHPHDGHYVVGDGSAGADPQNPVWSDDLRNYNSVMSYESEGYYQVDSPMMYDYWIMKALYGGPTISDR